MTFLVIRDIIVRIDSKGVILLSSMELIRNEIESQIGKKVILRANRGRKKIVTKRGIIDSVFPSLFVVELLFKNSPSRKVTFTYSDVLTNTVELMICEDEITI